MDLSDGCLRDTSVLVAVLETSEIYIIISLSTRNDTQVVYIDPTTGSLCYAGKLGHDIFWSEEEALKYITDGSRILCKTATYARAVLGYSALGNFGLLLVATKLSATVPNLPCGGFVYTVTESQWIKIPLQNSQPQGKGELKNIQELCELDIDGKHYFCETSDITRAFPSRMTSQNPDDEFVWNGWFSKSFKDIGLPGHCVVLLQGFAECRNFGVSGQYGGVVALIARRSRLHPGTRYLARGLNACSSTGNEVECEQLVWIPRSTGQSVPFSSYIWRRGTIPIWWGAELKFTAAEAEIYVAAQDPYRKSPRYYHRLSKRYGAQSSDLTKVGQKKAPSVPIICINLLRYGEGKPETILVEHFRESVKYIKSTGKLPNTWIQLIDYDWHANVKSKGEQQTVEGLWRHLKAPTMVIGFCEGTYIPSLQRLRECKGLVVSNNQLEGGFCLRSLQNGVIRFNCADSLDRTNAASFFGALQVFVEQCRRLGISLDRGASFGFAPINRNSELSNYGGKCSPLPPGWEERSDAVTGKPYFINHHTRTTTWEHPFPDKAWKRFDMTFDQFKSSTMLSPINQLADLFLLAGDIHATLYTGSKAMHSHIINIFTDEGGKFSKFSVAQNVKITLQRRYQNVIVDGSRQKQLEMFLGMRLFKHLPSVPLHPLKVLSRPSGCFLKPLGSMFPIANDGSSLLSFKQKDLIWVCPSDADVVELFIYLGEPCHVCQLLLTVAHGAEDSSYPATVDVRVGSSLDKLKLVLEGASIPQCSNGTNLLIPLTGKVNPEDLAITGNSAHLQGPENSHLPLLYNFEELEGELNFLTRVIALSFYSSEAGKTPVTIGEIEVLGVSLPWAGIFNKTDTGIRFVESIKERSRHSHHSLYGPDLNSKNPFPSVSSHNYNSGASLVNQASTAIHTIDLLSGDPVLSDPTPEPDVLSVAESKNLGSEDLINPFASSDADDPFSANSALLKETHKACDGTEDYINLCKSFFCSHKFEYLLINEEISTEGKKVDFSLAMRLEIERLRLSLSAPERDRALLSIGIDPATIDPNCLLDESYMVRLCSSADSLALLGHAAFEDRANASIGLEEVDNDIIDFWNINAIGETCSSKICEIRAEIESPTKVFPSAHSSVDSSIVLVCSQCERKTCKFCCAGTGAVLANNNYSDKIYNGISTQSGSSHGGFREGPYLSQSEPLDRVICKSCCSEIVLHALYVDYVRGLCSSRRTARADNAAQKAVDEVVGPEANTIFKYWENIDINNSQLKVLLSGEDSLAEFPYASLLHEVDTARGSEPLMSLIAPLGIGKQDAYWKATPSVSTVEFSIVLGTLSDVSGVALIISSCGYSTNDCPIVQIWASNKIHMEERSCMGKWDVQSLISSSEYEPAPSHDSPRHAKFTFRNPVRCRIIWIKFTLPQHASSSVSLDGQYNLLSLDDNFFETPIHRVSSAETIRRDACIHAKRLIVYGRSLRKEMDQNASQKLPEMMKMRSFLERAPQSSRFRVPIEAERLTDNDLVLEQFVSPTVPGLEGFRLDAFNVTLPRVMHSPTLNGNTSECSLTCLEDRHINPAILYVQVSAVQGPRNFVTVGEYRLPVVRAGTPLYFDFPRPIQTQRIVFRLLGDVAAFADDIAQQDDSNPRSYPLASGLSLSNRIKLYYYADPYELGKLANLSAV